MYDNKALEIKKLGMNSLLGFILYYSQHHSHEHFVQHLTIIVQMNCRIFK